MRQILAISGKMRSGKDTFAAIFLDVAHGRKIPWVRSGFADALKHEVATDLGISFEDLEANKDIHRPLLIAHGQRRRAEDDLYWVKRALATPGHLIIPDMRFPNELAFLKSEGAMLMRVEALISEREKRGKIIDDPTTENQLDTYTPWDWFIFNNGTTETFKETAVELSHEILTAVIDNPNRQPTS